MKALLFGLILSAAFANGQSLSPRAGLGGTAYLGTQQTPTLPLSTPSYAFPSGLNSPKYVHSGGNLQTALSGAVCGDEIILDAGAVFSANFTISSANNCSSFSASHWIYVHVAGNSRFGGITTRVHSTDAANMAQINQGTNSNPALTNSGSAVAYWWFDGIEFANGNGTNLVYSIVSINNGCPSSGQVAATPHHIVFTHSLFHGNVNADQQYNGLYLDTADTMIAGNNFYQLQGSQNSLSEANGIKSQCALGPWNIQNNTFSASTQGFFLGTANWSLIPSDITFQGNYVTKDLNWANSSYCGVQLCVVKNGIEFKNAKRVLVAGNVIENVWAGGGQTGECVAFSPRTNLSGGAPTWFQTQVSDVTVINNVCRNSQTGVDIYGIDSYCTGYAGCTYSQRGLIQNNLFALTGSVGGSVAQAYYVYGIVPNATHSLSVLHNTFIVGGGTGPNQSVHIGGWPMRDLILRDNVMTQDFGADCYVGPVILYSITSGSSACLEQDGSTLPTLGTQFDHNFVTSASTPGGTPLFTSSAFTSSWGSYCSSCRYDTGSVGFADTVSYQLASGSPFVNQASDGTSPGWNSSAINVTKVVAGTP